MSLLASLCLLIIVVYDWLLVTAIIFIGFVLSYLSVGDSVNIGLLSLEFIPIFFVYRYRLYACNTSAQNRPTIKN